MPSYSYYINTKASDPSGPDRGPTSFEAWYDFEIMVDYEVYGKYVPATHEDPAEYPEIEVERFRIPEDLAAMLGISPILDSERVEKHLGDTGRENLMDDLIHDHAERTDEPR